MFRFILSFLAGFGIVYYLLRKDEKSVEKEEKNKNKPLKFPPEPEGLENTDKFLNLLKTFNKMKDSI